MCQTQDATMAARIKKARAYILDRLIENEHGAWSFNGSLSDHDSPLALAARQMRDQGVVSAFGCTEFTLGHDGRTELVDVISITAIP